MKSKLQPKDKSGQIETTGISDRIIKVLIVSHPGMMQNVLQDTFSRRGDVDVVGVASGGLSAVDMIKQQPFDMVVIDSNLPEAEVSMLISWLKNLNQRIHSLVLVETTKQLNRTASTGADIALPSYSLPDSLDAVLANLNIDEG